MSIKASKGAKKKCDALASRLVRARGFCQNCGERDYRQLQCCHIVSRRYSATRCDLDNLLCLCATDHFRFTNWPLEFAEFVINQIGEDGYQRLVAKSQSRLKADWEAELERLASLAKASL